MAEPALEVALFDLDGTLVDSIEAIRTSLRDALAAHGKHLAEDAWLEGLGRPLRDQLAPYARDADELARLVEAYRAVYGDRERRLARPYAGAVDAVRRLRARGLRIGVVTSKRREPARSSLERSGFAELVEVLVAADDVRRGKPHPEPVRHALASFSARPEVAVFVGDSPHDLAAGRAAGTRTAAVSWGPFPRELLAAERPDAWLATPADIARLAECLAP